MNAALSSMVALRQLQIGTNATITMRIPDGQHLGIPVRHPIAYTRHRVEKSNELVILKCTQDQAADTILGHQHSNRYDFDIRKTPSFTLQLHTFLELL
jgi:hypothetical protein